MDKAEAKQVNEAMMKKLAEIEQELGAKFGLDGSITVYKDHVSFKMVAADATEENEIHDGEVAYVAKRFTNHPVEPYLGKYFTMQGVECKTRSNCRKI